MSGGLRSTTETTVEPVCAAATTRGSVSSGRSVAGTSLPSPSSDSASTSTRKMPAAVPTAAITDVSFLVTDCY
jgi:hypothetical protein